MAPARHYDALKADLLSSNTKTTLLRSNKYPAGHGRNHSSREILNVPVESETSPSLSLDTRSISSDEEVLTRDSGQSYVKLLKALKSHNGPSEPDRKRRKFNVQASGDTEGHHRISKEDCITQPLESNNNSTNLSPILQRDAGDDIGDEESLFGDEDVAGDPFSIHVSDSRLDQLNNLLSVAPLKWKRSSSKPIPGWKVVTSIPQMLPGSAHNQQSSEASIPDLYLKQKLTRDPSNLKLDLSAEYSQMALSTFNYQDVLFTERSWKNGSNLRQLYCLHLLNHVLKTKDRVVRNNARISKLDDGAITEFRDQGFTRPKVLVLLPTRQSCARLMETITVILQPDQQENKRRFLDTFSSLDDLAKSDKPGDFKETFSGNDDDKFMIGVKITRKAVKYFSNFYTSDIIVASPLGLHGKITSGDKRKQDWDYLSSIEIAVLDQADALLAQNWETVDSVIEHLNLEPKEAHGCDFARVRRWYLDSRAKHFRQTLVLSAFNAPELNSLFERSMSNISGKVKMSREEYSGAMMHLNVQTKQTFTRFDTASLAAEPEARFKHFTASVVPLLSKYAQSGKDVLAGTLIFIPSYMDFLRVQNFFFYSNGSQTVTFNPEDPPCISEYADRSQNARAKSLFQSGRHPLLLYTGRAHHFYRYKLTGVKRVVLYELPDNPLYYQEIVGDYLSRSVSEGRYSPDDISVSALFSRFDVMKIERIVGTKRASAMIREANDIFVFS